MLFISKINITARFTATTVTVAIIAITTTDTAVITILLQDIGIVIWRMQYCSATAYHNVKSMSAFVMLASLLPIYVR